MYKNLQKAIDWGVKFASIAITGPATWQVAGDLFFDIQNPVLLFVMKVSAVFLVEGVLFSNWLLLEFDVKATPELKARYAFTALIMYVVLAVIGFQHEGFVGIVFRIALLLALVGSGWDTYVYTWQRATSRVDRSVSNSRRVKRHARRLAIKEALMSRESDHRVTAELNALEEQASLQEAKLYGSRLLEKYELSDMEARIELEERRQKLLALTDKVQNALPAPNGNPNGKKNRQTSQSLAQTDVMTASGTVDLPAITESEIDDQLVIHSILDAYADDPRISYKAIAQKYGFERDLVQETVREMEKDGLIIREGRKRYPAEDAEDLYDIDRRSRKKKRR